MQLNRLNNKSAGFSLIEVLITVLILSVGLLGLAGMQALAISNASIAGMRSIAAMQASSAAAAVGANPQFWAAGSSSLSITVSSSGITNAPAGYVDCTTTVCTGAQIAMYDMTTWQQSLTTRLPNGGGTISCPVPLGNPAPPVACTVMVTWTEKNLVLNQSANATAGTTYSYQMVVQP